MNKIRTSISWVMLLLVFSFAHCYSALGVDGKSAKREDDLAQQVKGAIELVNKMNNQIVLELEEAVSINKSFEECNERITLVVRGFQAKILYRFKDIPEDQRSCINAILLEFHYITQNLIYQFFKPVDIFHPTSADLLSAFKQLLSLNPFAI